MFKILEISAAILASLGGAGIIILGMSNWLGKIWADRLIAKYKQELDLEYEHQLSQQSRRRKLYEEFSNSLEKIFADKQDDIL